MKHCCLAASQTISCSTVSEPGVIVCLCPTTRGHGLQQKHTCWAKSCAQACRTSRSVALAIHAMRTLEDFLLIHSSERRGMNAGMIKLSDDKAFLFIYMGWFMTERLESKQRELGKQIETILVHKHKHKHIVSIWCAFLFKIILFFEW